MIGYFRSQSALTVSDIHHTPAYLGWYLGIPRVLVSTGYPPKPPAIKPGLPPGVTVLICIVSYLFILIVAIVHLEAGECAWCKNRQKQTAPQERERKSG